MKILEEITYKVKYRYYIKSMDVEGTYYGGSSEEKTIADIAKKYDVNPEEVKVKKIEGG